VASQRVAQAGRLKRQGLSPYARVGFVGLADACVQAALMQRKAADLQHCPSRRETASRGSRTIGRSGDACRRPRQAGCADSRQAVAGHFRPFAVHVYIADNRAGRRLVRLVTDPDSQAPLTLLCEHG